MVVDSIPAPIVTDNEPKSTRKQKRDFSLLGLSARRLKILEGIGYEKPTPVQAGLIPLVLQGIDLIGQARTGTGKTAAFGIPIVERLEALRASSSAAPETPAPDEPKASDPETHPGRGRNRGNERKPQPSGRLPRAIVLVPTRELCLQVHQEIHRLAGHSPPAEDIEQRQKEDVTLVKSVPVYGGKSMQWQIRQLASGADIVVGTPGRIIDHLNRGTLNVRDIDTVVLDEADRMLDIGFRPDIERILRRMPQQRQMLLLSATLPPPILHLARNYMHHPQLVNFSSQSLSVDTIDQYYMTVREDEKVDVLVQMLERENPRQAIVFCRTRLGTERLYRKLIKTPGLEHVRAIHGDMSQPNRDSVMASFRSGETRVLVATDVVGRGIDVTRISHIINFDVPEMSDDYVHRVGRAGRMGREGAAYTLVTALQRSELRQIEKRIGKELMPYRMDGFDAMDVKEIKSTSRRVRRHRRAL